jgi:PucR C-terminal helix-turn-helix domain
VSRPAGPGEEPRVRLVSRLRARLPEMEAEMLTRIEAIAPPATVPDPSYLEGLRLALRCAVSYGLSAVEHGVERLAPPPPPLRSQAALAARNGVGLEIVVHRYCAGYALLCDFVVEEAAAIELAGGGLKAVLRDHAAVFDRIVAAVTEEYAKEERGRHTSESRRRVDQVLRLLNGEQLGGTDLGYELGGAHLGAIAIGAGGEAALRGVADALDRRLLVVWPQPSTCWAWFGGRQPLGAEALEQLRDRASHPDLVVSIGEPAEGLVGWRLTQRQALVTLAVARRRPGRAVLYRDVPLLAAVLADGLLAGSLRQLYLAPLGQARDGGAVARETLRAYFAADQNVSSAAALLRINRGTVAKRLQRIEERLPRPLDCCGPELAVALQLADLEGQQGD